jgi:hypothetical protein
LSRRGKIRQNDSCIELLNRVAAGVRRLHLRSEKLEPPHAGCYDSCASNSCSARMLSMPARARCRRVVDFAAAPVRVRKNFRHSHRRYESRNRKLGNQLPVCFFAAVCWTHDFYCLHCQCERIRCLPHCSKRRNWLIDIPKHKLIL